MKHSKEKIRQAVKQHYGSAITRGSGCCGPAPADIDPEAIRKYTGLAGYSAEDLAGIPETATSFGCGNPVNFTDVKPGETVLDLGSGAGMDLILAARKVGETGKVIGLDMTPEMIDVCKRNLAAAGIKNFEIRMGEMESMPVEDNEVDWIISNCVINLSPEKEKVFAEAYRVLKPGGQMLVADLVTNGLSREIRDNLMAWVGCISGAVEEEEYLGLARTAGFVDIKIVDKMTYTRETLDTLANDACGCGASERTVDEAVVDAYAGRVASIKLYAKKPM